MAFTPSRSRVRRILLGVGALIALGAQGSTASNFAYHQDASSVSSGWVVVDSRTAQQCEVATIASARCLPAADFFGPHRRLASIAEIAWLLGTAGLDGNESVLVIGDDATDRDFVAGMLFIMGQRQVRILADHVSRLVSSNKLPKYAGVARSQVRETVYSASSRTRNVVFGLELFRMYSRGAEPRLLDGRSEKAFWGLDSNGRRRGGHLPGADHLPAVKLRAEVSRGDAIGPAPARGPFVVYGDTAHDGVAFFTLVSAGLGLDTKVYLPGWSEWATKPWPADAVSYPPQFAAIVQSPTATSNHSQSWILPSLLSGCLLAGVAAAVGFFIGRKRPA